MKAFYLSSVYLIASLHSSAQLNQQTVAGMTHIGGYTGDGGPARLAYISLARSVVTDKAGNIYISNGGPYNVIRKIDFSLNISTIAGTGSAGFGMDGVPATASAFKDIQSMCMDTAGNMYVSDMSFRIRKIDAVTKYITTIAGITGTMGYSGDGGFAAAAKIYAVGSMCVDKKGNLLIAQPYNHTIRSISLAGIITTIAGMPDSSGFSGDGDLAKKAKMMEPAFLAVDTVGNIFIGDAGNSRIRKIDTHGIITTYAGTGVPVHAGDGGPATSAGIGMNYGLTFNAHTHDLYFYEYGSGWIRKINALGMISTVAGNGIEGYSGEGVAPDSAVYPMGGICFDTVSNELFFAEGSRLRKLTNQPYLTLKNFNTLPASAVVVYPNPSNGNFTIVHQVSGAKAMSAIVFDLLGRAIIHKQILFNSNRCDFNVSAPAGIYILELESEDGNSYRERLIIQ